MNATDTIEHPTNGSCEDAATQLASLRGLVDRRDEEIVEKDEIIGALTDRLEKVAEQLDRVKRSGADRGPQKPDADAAAKAGAVSEGLQTLLDQFDGVDLGGSLNRIELLLGELRDTSFERIESRTEVTPEQSPAPKPDLLGGWDSIRNSLLNGDEQTPAAESPARENHEDAAPVERAEESDLSSTEDVESSETEDAPPTQFLTLPEEPPEVDPLPDELPEPVDVETADRETLAAAVECRDRYINALTRRLSDRRAKLTVPTNWEILAPAGDELVEMVERLHAELDDAVRTAEVDLCLERARLSRERTRLEKLQESLAETPAASNGAAPEKSGRWKRMLGIDADA